MATLRRWWITLVTAAVTAAVLVGAGALLLGGGDQRDVQAAQAAGSTAPAGPRLGQEGVPLLRGAPLGPARSPRAGASSGGVPCGSREQLTYHVHARLTLLVNGKPRSVPLGIGIGAPVRISDSGRGPFASGGSCFSFLHTHAADGIIHIEAPGAINFTLGQFFDVWRQRLDGRHLGKLTGRVVAYVNGQRYRGDPRAILLLPHAQIHLELGRPHVTPDSITFPRGL